MNERQIEFRRHLLESSRRMSTIQQSDLLTQLSNFSKTPEFHEAFRKWELLHPVKRPKYRPKQWIEIYNAIVQDGRR